MVIIMRLSTLAVLCTVGTQAQPKPTDSPSPWMPVGPTPGLSQPSKQAKQQDMQAASPVVLSTKSILDSSPSPTTKVSKSPSQSQAQPQKTQLSGAPSPSKPSKPDYSVSDMLPSRQSKPDYSVSGMLSDGVDGQAYELTPPPTAQSAQSPFAQSPSRQSPSAAASNSLTKFSNSIDLNGHHSPQQMQSGTQAMMSLQSILTGVTGAGSTGAAANTLSTQSSDVVSGLLEAFMHKVNLQPGEKSCLRRNIGQITGNVMATGQDIVTAVKLLMNPNYVAQDKKTSSLVSTGVDSALKITSLVTLSSQLLKNCVHGDALEMLKTTGRHFINAQYVGHRFLVNGVDIAHGLADCVVAFEAQDFRRFGKDIGTALRKILLSNAERGTLALPEGVPEQDIVQKVTEGVMRGFFVQGSGIVITDTADPDVNIVLNLHQCIAGNSLFFKEIWNGLWSLFAALSLNRQQHGLGPLPGIKPAKPSPGLKSQPKWAGELMIALLQFPMALQRCGIGTETQAMFAEAVHTLRYVKIKPVFPSDQIQAMKATDRMARAVEAWTNWDFTTFGRQMGMLLRELVMLAFPRKYSVDNAGKLRRELLGYSSQTDILPGVFPSVLVGKQSSKMFTCVVCGCAVSIFVALAAVRSIWATTREFDHLSEFTSMEGGECEMEGLYA